MARIVSYLVELENIVECLLHIMHIANELILKTFKQKNTISKWQSELLSKIWYLPSAPVCLVMRKSPIISEAAISTSSGEYNSLTPPAALEPCHIFKINQGFGVITHANI